MSNKIVVGYNGTESSSKAVRWAADEARVREVAFRVVSCFEFPPIVGDAGFGAGAVYDAVRTTAETNAATIRTSIGESHPDVSLTVDVVPGPAATRLLDGVGPDDLVAVGASSHDGAAAFWLGTTRGIWFITVHAPLPSSAELPPEAAPIA